MVRVILDVMGGDYAPKAALEGALEALPDLTKPHSELVLLGDEKVIRSHLAQRKFRRLAENSSVRIVHAPQNIDMEDSIRAIRSKPEATINVGCRLAGKSFSEHDAIPTAFVSAGHSGAVMASALLNMGRLRNVERPPIAVRLPTLSPDGCVMLDVGANVDCKPEHLRDFAVMGSIFAQTERKSSGLPKVGILSNGEERKKGNELTRAALELIEKLPCFQDGPHAAGRLIGYVEGKEIFKGQVDVVVCDGFVGNVVLKSLEGLGSAVVRNLKQEAKASPITALGFLLAAPAFRRLKRKLDYAEYGAAPLLGVAGYAFICHGRSNPKAMKNALLRAHAATESRFVEKMEAALASTHNVPPNEASV